MKRHGTHTSHTPSGNEDTFENCTKQKPLKRKLKYFHTSILALLGSAALLSHISENTEYPNFLPRTPTLSNKKVTWDEFTKNEIHKLAKEYAEINLWRAGSKKIATEDLEKKFLEFISAYGADIRIIPPEQGDILNLTLLRLGNRGKNTAHYGPGNTLVYPQKLVQKNKNGSPIAETSGLDDFIAEFSHHLNGDIQAGRIIAYTKDLARKGFQQDKMYGDIYSSEYQAHSVTEVALKAYLEPNNIYPFPEIYNLHHSYYRKIMDGEEYEEMIDKAYLLDTFTGGDTESLLQYRETAFSNLDTIRTLINKTDLGREKKSLLFRYLINEGFIGLKDIDYELLAQNVDFSKVNTPECLSDFYYDKPSE